MWIPTRLSRNNFSVLYHARALVSFCLTSGAYADKGELGMDCSARPQIDDFVLNKKEYQGSELLLARENFGCGSSREHAVWALLEHGFSAVIAPSFGDIFANNAVKNGLLPLVLPADTVAQLFTRTRPYVLRVDLAEQQVSDKEGNVWTFALLDEVKQRLLLGLDDIGQTLQHADDIRAYEQRRRQQEPWLFDNNTVA